MKIRLALLLACLIFACPVLLATRPALAQKPGAGSPKPASNPTPSSPPSHTEPSPVPAQPSHPSNPSRPESPKTGETHLPNRPIAAPERLPKVPKANPIKPEHVDRPANVSLRNSKKIDKPVLALKAALAPAQQTIVPKIPIVFWPSPMTIHQGEPLADALTGASAEVPGFFSYSPGLSYVPPPGDCVVLIDFSPTDTVRYLSTSATVHVKVL